MKSGILSKSAFFALVLFVLLYTVSGCAGIGAGPRPSDSASPEIAVVPGTSATTSPGGGAQGGQTADPSDAGASPASPGKTSSLYDPSIFVIEVEGSWRQELAPGYFADYECALYIDKVDSNDNRTAAGLYTGVFWMKATLDTEEFLSDLLGDAPIEMQFDAGGEGVCDNLTMHLLDGYERDPFENFAIPAGEGDSITPAQNALADNGSFIVSGISAYLEAEAHGAQGEEVQYQNSDTGDGELSYVIHVAPDPSGSATEIPVTFYLTSSNGASVTLEGVLRRLPGYPEDVLEYANAGNQNAFLDKYRQ